MTREDDISDRFGFILLWVGLVMALMLLEGGKAHGRAADCYWFLSTVPADHEDGPHDPSGAYKIRVHYKSGHSILIGHGDYLPIGCNVDHYTVGTAVGPGPYAGHIGFLAHPPGCHTATDPVDFGNGIAPVGTPMTLAILGCNGCDSCDAVDPGKPNPGDHPNPGGDGGGGGGGGGLDVDPKEPDGIRNFCDPDEVACIDLDDNGCCDHCDAVGWGNCAAPDLSGACNPEMVPCVDDDDDGICETTTAGIACPAGEDGSEECQPGAVIEGAFGKVGGDSNGDGIADWCAGDTGCPHAETEYLEGLGVGLKGACITCVYERYVDNSYEVWDYQNGELVEVVSRDEFWAAIGVSSFIEAQAWCGGDSQGNGICDACEHDPPPEPDVECSREEHGCCRDADGDGQCDFCASSSNCAGDEDEDGICDSCDKDYQSSSCDDEDENGVCDDCEKCDEDCPDCPCADRLDRIIELLEGTEGGSGEVRDNPEFYHNLNPPDAEFANLMSGLGGLDHGEYQALQFQISVPVPGQEAVELDYGSISMPVGLSELGLAIEAFRLLLYSFVWLMFVWMFVRKVLARVGQL